MPSLWEGVYDKMNIVKYRALAKDGTWRYGLYPCLNVDMGNTKYPMDVFWNSFLSAFRRETLGQWTGLLDKQGKEIYEGDIVRRQNGTDEKPLKGHQYKIVQWWYTPTSTHYNGWNMVRPEKYEVIGNIYEKKESYLNPHHSRCHKG